MATCTDVREHFHQRKIDILMTLVDDKASTFTVDGELDRTAVAEWALRLLEAQRKEMERSVEKILREELGDGDG